MRLISFSVQQSPSAIGRQVVAARLIGVPEIHYQIALEANATEHPDLQVGQIITAGIDIPPLAGIRGEMRVISSSVHLLHDKLCYRIELECVSVTRPTGNDPRGRLTPQDHASLGRYLAAQRGQIGVDPSWDRVWDEIGYLVPETRRREAMQYVQQQARDQLTEAERERRVTAETQRILREQEQQEQQKDQQQRQLQREAVERARTQRTREQFDRLHPERKRKIDLEGE